MLTLEEILTSNVAQPMERVKALINTLQEQAQQNAGPAVLLATLQQIQLELTGGVASARQLGTAKVAVVMPSHSRFMPSVQETTDVVKKEEPVQVQKEKAYEAVQAKQVSQPVYEEQEVAPKRIESNGWSFDPMKEIPTLTHQTNGKELNDIIGQNGLSLNDRLKTEQTELAELLTESPIRDLKKGIGINDRYVFFK